MPDFDFCVIDGSEWLILTAILLGCAVAVGLFLGTLRRWTRPDTGPSIAGFGIGCLAPTTIGIGLVVALGGAIDPPGDNCGFTSDAVGLIFFIPLVPLVIISTLWWRSRAK
jgi:hypothetical protein